MALTGRLVLLLALGLLPVLVRPETDTVWLWLLLVLVLAAVDGTLAPRPDRLGIVRGPGGVVRQGSPTRSELVVTNPGPRRLRGRVRDAWPPAAGATGERHPLRLPAGGSARLVTDLCPTRRGEVRAGGVTVRLTGPLGLVARQATRAVPGAVRSLPAFASRRHLPSRLARLRELDGRAAVRVRGEGTEFDSLREYVDGDDVRSVDWRASARSRTTVVRTWQPERDRRVVLVLDTSRTSAGRVGDVPRLDAAMDAALLLATLAGRAGDRVDLVAGDRLVRARLRLPSGPGVTGPLQDTLAGLEPVIAEADWATLTGAVAALGRARALVVLLTPVEPAAVEAGLLPVLPALTRRHRVVVASVRDPALARLAGEHDDVAAAYTAAAAEHDLARRRQTAAVLEALGVHVLDRDADALPPALADHYLLLKARGRL